MITDDEQEKLLEDFELVFGSVDREAAQNDPIMYDAIFLTHNFGFDVGNTIDCNGYSTMHYCVASLIANHKYKLKKDVQIRQKYSWSSNWKQENKWELAVQIFLRALNRGASVNVLRRDKEGFLGCTPLIYAIEKHAPLDVLKLLIRYGAYVDQNVGNSFTCALRSCFDADYIEAAQLLLEVGADPNILLDGVFSPLEWILDEYNEENPDFDKMNRFLKLFLEYGSDPDLVSDFRDYCKEPKMYFKKLETNDRLKHKEKTFKMFENYKK